MNRHLGKILTAPVLCCLLSGCAVLQTTGEVVGELAKFTGEVVLGVADLATFGAISSLTGFEDANWSASPESSAWLYSEAASIYASTGSAAASGAYSTTGSSPQSDDANDFVPELLRDFRVRAPDGLVEVCVWDHECEDGDILSVAINGKQYQTELRNAKSCRKVQLHDGANAIRIVAMNGTGNKGSCSFANVNTGTISVGSLSSFDNSSQTYKIRGGQGSAANIVVYK